MIPLRLALFRFAHYLSRLFQCFVKKKIAFKHSSLTTPQKIFGLGRVSPIHAVIYEHAVDLLEKGARSQTGAQK